MSPPPPSPSPSPREARLRRPGRPRLEESEGAEVRERLIDAATALAVECGFDACGLREIAARAEVSPGMIAYYFGDREGLHEAMFERAFERVTEQVRALLESEPESEPEPGSDPRPDEPDAAPEAVGPPIVGDRLDELIRIHARALAADPWLPKLIARDILSAGDTGMRERAAERLRRGPVPIIVRWIEEEQASGRLRSDLDARWLAISIASLTVFPFLALPIVGDGLGIELDDEGLLRLIEHNRQLLDRGVRAAPIPSADRRVRR